jgi:Carboxypeptidase regulatory-like domain
VLEPEELRLAILSFLITCCLSQSNTATITGTVVDMHGAAIAGAAVVAVHDATGIRTEVRTNQSGAYAIPGLPVGPHSVSIEKAGFRRYAHTGFTLTTGQILELNATLDLGAITEAINVSSREPLVDTRTSDVGQTFDARSIENLPLGNRRTMNIVQTSGVATVAGSDGIPTYSLAGGRLQSQMVWLDGGTGQNIRIGVGQQNVDPPVEAVQDIRVLANNYSAEYGGSAGGVIIETTRSGTNQSHGSTYEYLRNDAMDAPGFFAPIVNGAKQTPALRYNVFGVTAGGPIHRNQTFFFAAYEGTRRHTGSVTTLTVPTDLQRAGDFSSTMNAQGTVIPVYDPAGSPRQPFPRNVVPKDQLDPVGLRVVNYFPRPSRVPDNLAGANNFRSNSVTAVNSDFLLAKLDHSFNDRNKLTVRYIGFRQTTDPSSVYPDVGVDPAIHSRGSSQYAHADWTRIATRARVNDLRYTYVNRSSEMLSQSVGGDYPAKIGLTGVDRLAFPRFQFAGNYSPLGSAVQQRRQFPIEQHQVVENLASLHARHAWKAGGETRFSRNQDVNLQSISGAFQFSAQSTGSPQGGTGGNALASLLLGLPLSFGEAATPALDRHSWYLSGFFKDDWSATRNLTLNAGLRWEIDTPMVDANRHMSGFDPVAINPVSNTPGVVRFAGIDGYSGYPYRSDWNNFGPRFGFAWKPPGSQISVIRGGYGIFFAHPLDSTQTTAASLGFSVSALLASPDNGVTAPFHLRDGVPPITLVSAPRNDAFGAVPVGQPASTVVGYFERDRVSGYAHQFNLTMQRELPASIVVEAGAIGNLGRKLASANLNINQIPPQLLGPDHKSQADRPFPQFSNVMLLAPSLGISNYYAALFKLEKRLSHGLNLTGSYTWSKFLGNTNDTANPDAGRLGQNNGPYSDYYHRRADYGPLESDVENRFLISAVCELPFGKGHHWLRGGLPGILAGGWTIGALASLQSGVPLTAVTSADTTNAFPSGSQRTNVARDPNLPSSRRSLTRWFDTASFSQPAAFTFGNEGLGIIRSGGWTNADFSLLRNFALTEHARLQFRGEFFNALNHTALAPPGVILGTPTFGLVGFTAPPRQIQLGARLMF